MNAEPTLVDDFFDKKHKKNLPINLFLLRKVELFASYYHLGNSTWHNQFDAYYIGLKEKTIANVL